MLEENVHPRLHKILVITCTARTETTCPCIWTTEVFLYWPSVTKCAQVNPSESKWFQVSPLESKSPSEPTWIQVNPSESKWTHVYPIFPQIPYPSSAGLIGIYCSGSGHWLHIVVLILAIDEASWLLLCVLHIKEAVKFRNAQTPSWFIIQGCNIFETDGAACLDGEFRFKSRPVK